MKRIIFSALVALSSGAFANVSDYGTIHDASIHGDIAKMEKICRNLGNTTGTADAIYLAAYCEYRTAYSGMSRLNDPAVKAKVSSALTRASDGLQQLLKTDGARRAEGLALQAIVYGMQIGVDPSKGAVLGEKAWSAAREAESLEPANPRVQFAKAGNLLFTPAAHGGDIAAAGKALDLAKGYYPARPAMDNWGLDDVYLYSAIMHTQSRQFDLAKADLRQALAVSPGHGWAILQLNKLP